MRWNYKKKPETPRLLLLPHPYLAWPDRHNLPPTCPSVAGVGLQSAPEHQTETPRIPRTHKSVHQTPYDAVPWVSHYTSA